ncbi:MAG: serine/threonine protein kinase [Candidatus Eremiobacteraeota bacterium]|nr:serine/threonine protein kinase [Candidatus Eremiobacteraeota bacterium]
MSRAMRLGVGVLCGLVLLLSPALAEREVVAPSQPDAEILIDSKETPRTVKSSQQFTVGKADFGDEESLRLVFQAPGYARQARFLHSSILEESGIFYLSETLLYRQHVQIKYNAYPPDAALSLEEISGQGMKPHYLGKFPQLNVADRYDLSRGKFLMVNLLLERKGYQPWRRKVALNSLAEPGKDIAFLGDIELEPKKGWDARWEQIKVLHRFNTPVAIFYDLIILGIFLSVPLFLWPRYLEHKKQKELWKRKAMLESVITDTDPLLKKVLGGYYLTAKIGRGGMSKVYRGLPEQTLELDEAVAVKVIDEDLADSEEYRARFRREIEVCASINNPNVVKLIDWGERDKLLFMVQELVDGQTLKQACKEPLSQARFVHIFVPILRALRAAHAKGVIHRDLKPSNVMITPTDVVKLMDFGLAKANKPGHDLTRTGDAFGTPAYMSPEQISGGIVEAPSDLYSLGVMAFELLTGRLPYDVGEDPMSVMLAHLQKEPYKLKDFRPDLDQQLSDLVASLLMKEPSQRETSIERIMAILEMLPRSY